MAKRPIALILLLVLLRLATGWHFYSEGSKKLDSNFSSAGFLRIAKGPLAPMFKGYVTGPHEGYTLLSEPHQAGSLDAEKQNELDAWQANYNAVAAYAVDKRKPLPSLTGGEIKNKEGKVTRKVGPVPSQANFAPWLTEIQSDWQESLDRFGKMPSVTDENREAAQKLVDTQLAQVQYYLVGQQGSIADAQHEAWRLVQVRKEATDSPAPFFAKRIAEKEADIHRSLQPWTRTIAGYEEGLFGQIASLVDSPEGSSDNGDVEAAEDLLIEETPLRQVDRIVTWTLIIAGIALFIGLFTRIAAIALAGFLLSVMATQPFWVAGANTEFFFYQLVEVLALLLLAVVGAGQWAGLDVLFKYFWLPAKDAAATTATTK